MNSKDIETALGLTIGDKHLTDGAKLAILCWQINEIVRDLREKENEIEVMARKPPEKSTAKSLKITQISCQLMDLANILGKIEHEDET